MTVCKTLVHGAINLSKGEILAFIFLHFTKGALPFFYGRTLNLRKIQIFLINAINCLLHLINVDLSMYNGVCAVC